MRAISPADEPFLQEMVDAALFWRPTRRGDPLQALKRAVMRVVARKILAKYHQGWGRTGDTGFVVEADGQPIGAVWYRSFTAADHGDGFVDEQTPELVIAVREGHRGRGIGRALMTRLAEQASRDGVARIALSVEPENPAKRLYVSLGYRDYEPVDKKGRMILELGERNAARAPAKG